MKTCYMFDIEGTLSDHSHRLHLIPPVINMLSDWSAFQKAFKDDPPNEAVVKLCQKIATSSDIVISTGMPIHMENEVRNFLNKNNINPARIMMREPDRHEIPINLRSDEVKLEHLERLRLAEYEVLGIFDDNIEVCKAFMKNGVEAFHLPFQGFVEPKIQINKD